MFIFSYIIPYSIIGMIFPRWWRGDNSVKNSGQEFFKPISTITVSPFNRDAGPAIMSCFSNMINFHDISPLFRVESYSINSATLVTGNDVAHNTFENVSFRPSLRAKFMILRSVGALMVSK